MPLGLRVFVERHKTKAKAILYLRWWQEQKAKVTVQAVLQNVALAAKAQAEKMRLWPTGTTRWEWRASTWVVGASATGRWNMWNMPADLVLRSGRGHLRADDAGSSDMESSRLRT